MHLFGCQKRGLPGARAQNKKSCALQLPAKGHTPPAAKVHIPPSVGEQVAASQHGQGSRRSKQSFTVLTSENSI